MTTFSVSPKYTNVIFEDLDSGKLCIWRSGKELVYGVSVRDPQDDKDRSLLTLQGSFTLMRLDKGDAVLCVDDEWRFRLEDLSIESFVDFFQDVPPGKIAITNAGPVFNVGGSSSTVNLETFQIGARLSGEGFYTDWVIETRTDSSEEWRTFFDPSRHN